jgi:hypothetical protein
VIEALAKLIPPTLLDKSGSVFYAGRNAFKLTSPIYVLGLNPGGSPEAQADETIARHTHKVLTTAPDDWSAYRDEGWRNSPPGTRGMQPRVLHLMRRIGLGPGDIPASNVVFLRSEREASLQGNFETWAEVCWPFHEAVIRHLQPRVVLCFGGTAGRYVTSKLRATSQVGEFVENNRRKWRSCSLQNREGIVVVTATHPSIADWTSPDTDPSHLVIAALTK